MIEKLKYMPALLSITVIVIGLVLAGCSTGGTGSTTQDTSSSPAQTIAAPEQTGGAPASTAPASGSAASPSQSSLPSGRPGAPDMSREFSRAAQILGITEEQLTSAFQQAQESIFGKPPTGTPPSGTSGQRPPAPPSGTPGQQTPTSDQGPGQEMMQKVYSKMAEILNISADKISSAMEQARQEMQSGTLK